MNNIQIYRTNYQSISNDDIRRTILELANKNGGLIRIAEKSGISYHALWGQLNRNAGVLAKTIPMIVNGTGDLRPIQELCKACNCLATRRVTTKSGVRSIRKHELQTMSQLGTVVDLIEKAYADNYITKNEYREIHFALIHLRRLEAEIDEKIAREVKP